MTAILYGLPAFYDVGPHSESILFQSLVIVGRLLLFPGWKIGGAFASTVSSSSLALPITLAANGLIWLVCAWLVHAITEHFSGERLHRQAITLCVTTAAFVVINIIHSAHPAQCYDCFLPHGIPFTLYHEDGFAGGAAIEWTGLVADAAIVAGTSWVLGRLWKWSANKHISSRATNP